MEDSAPQTPQVTQKKTSPFFLAGLIVLIIAVGMLIFSKTPPPATILGTHTTNPPVKSSESVTSAAQMKTFVVTGSNFSFDPKEIRVTKGETVRITLKNADGFHDLNIDEFNAHTKKIPSGETQTITFVADKTGTFQYYCSISNHRSMGMWGNLIVQ